MRTVDEIFARATQKQQTKTAKRTVNDIFSAAEKDWLTNPKNPTNVQKRMQSWLDEHNALVKSYSDRFGGRNANAQLGNDVDDARQWYKSATATGTRLRTTAQALKQDLERNRSVFGDDYVNDALEALKSGMDVYADISKIADGEEKSWLTENASGFMTAADYDSEIARLDKEIGELQTYYLDRYDNAIKNLGAGSLVKEGIIAEINEKFGSRTELEEYIDSLKAQKWNYENGKKYGFLSENDDFAQQSKVATDSAKSKYLDTVFDTARFHYDLVNGFTDYGSAKAKEEGNVLLANLIDVKTRNLTYLTPDEKANYNYLYNTQGTASAEDYLKSLEHTLSDRSKNYTREEWSELATALPVQTSIASVPLNLWSGVGYLDALGQKVVNDIQEDITGEYAGPVNYNRAAMLPSVASSAVRSTVTQNLAQKYGTIDLKEEEHPILSKLLNGKSWGDVYQLGMSMADSAAVAVLSPVMGTAGTLMLSGSAATQTMLNAVENGATDEQALTMGALSGAFEYLFEKYELENLLKNGSENAVRAFVAQSLSEGFGEGATTIANTLADTIVMADKSEISRAAAAYMQADPSLSEQEARKKAWMDSGVQLFWDVVGGVASGGIMGGGYSAINSVAGAIDAQYQQNTAGRSVIGTEGGVDALKALALEMAGVSEGKIQGALTQQAEKVGKKATARNVGKLFADVSRTVNEQNTKDLAARLTEMGVDTQRATQIADAVVTARTDSERLTREQMSLLQESSKDDTVVNAVSAVLDTEGTAAYQRSAQLRSLMAEPVAAGGERIATSPAAPRNDGGVLSIKEQIKGNQDTLSQMEPVTAIETPKSFSQLDIAGKINWVIEKLRPTGYKVERKGFGTINFGSKQLKGAFKYFAKGSVEEAAFEALPYVLQNGVEIGEHSDHKGREHGTVTIAAPVTIDGQRGNMAAVVKQTTDNFYKVHRILTPDGSVFEMNTNEAEPTPSGGVTENGSLATPISSASNISISEPVAGVNGENVSELTRLAREKVDMDLAAAEETDSAEGQVLRDDDPVQIAGIDTAGNGKLTVKLTDGSTADVAELSFPEMGEQELWRVIGKYAEDADSARALLEEYRGGNLDAYHYARGVEEGFLYGKLNMSPKEMEQQGSYVNLLNPMQRNMAYKQGQIAGKKSVQQRQEKIARSTNNPELGASPEGPRNDQKKGALHFAGDRGKLTERQKVSLQTCEIVAKAMGIQVHVFESDKVGGKRVGDNGWYDPKDGSIHIDLHAGRNGEGVMVFTLAHELTHFIKDWSPAKFRTLSKFLAEQYAKNGQSVAVLVRDQQRRAAEDGRKLSFEQAHEEWVADSMETMLTDGTIVEKLSMLQAKDKSLVEKIKTFLKDFVKRLKAAYEGMSAQTTEGRIVGEMVDAAKALQDLFADALLDAGENFQRADKNTTGEGDVRFSAVRTSFATELQDWFDNTTHHERKNSGKRFLVGSTTNVLKSIGVKDYSIYFGGSKIDKILTDNESMTLDTIKDAVMLLEKPIIIMESLTVDKSIVLFGEVYTTGNKPVMISVLLNPKTKSGEILDYAVITSTYGRRNSNLQNLINNSKIYYIEPQKNRTDTWLKALGLQLPSAITKYGSINKVASSSKIVKENDSTEKRTSSRSGDVSDRAMLVDLFEQMVTDSNEYKALENYRKHIQEMLDIEEHLERISEEIRRLSFAEGPRDTETLNKLKLQQKKAVNRLNTYDNILLRLEKSGVLRAMIERNRKKITQESYDRTREYYRERNERREAEIRQYYRESRRKAVERHDKAQVRQQIRKDVQRLDSLLNKGTKEKNVKLELQDFAGAALRTAKGVFLKNYNEYDMVRSGVDVTLSREHKAVFNRCQELLKELDQIREQRDIEPGPNSLHEKWDPEADLRRDDREEALKKELAKNMAVLRDAGIFQLENERIEDVVSDKLMEELMAAYSALRDSESAHVREVFNSAIYDHMESVKKFLAGKAIKDMTTVELKELQKMYRMVLHTITTSNDLFAQKRKADVRKLGEEVISQLRTPGKEMTAEILDKLAKMGWANLKPETALELIGSDTLTEMMQGLYRGEDTYARDIEHARKYAEEQGKKYGRKNWDMEKTVTFAGTKITLGQAMSLYAYTKRKQAQGHLEGDGFTHGSNVRLRETMGKLPIKLSYIMNATKTHIVPKSAYTDVAELLTPEQRKYVDAMQEYLSKVMGAKGNEVSMQLYGVKLFEETMYFPLKTASEYREEALGATAGEVKLRNNGFTQKTVDGASNPIVLDSFENVWAGHIDKMSLYHGFVLPMEDFDRVYNYRHAVEEAVTDAEGEAYKTRLVDTNESVKVDIENKMGKAANAYIEDFMKQLNGGVRGDSTEKLFGSMVRNFKKTAVMGSLSVAVQQPTAFIRAMAYLDIRDVGNPKDFLGKAGKPEGKIVEEMYKYAPVALMKHIGGFDPGLGRTTRDYVFKNQKGVREALDKILGAFPEKMDEWTWSYIWVCTKRQIHRQNPNLKVNSEEFLQKAGERFSQIIRDTQVYDSVLTKSQVMRSKNVFLQMATSFMNEPATSMDMYIRSTIQAKRGKIKKSQACRTYAAVVGSQILTSAVVAFVYALRDDDEDETYWEKYLSAIVNKLWENTMPWYSIPFVKDIFSIFDGYSVERSDMSLFVDIYQGWQKLQSNKATPWEKTEAFAGSILNVFGIPLKNVSRDIRGIYNTVNTWINGGVEKTNAGLRYAALEGLTGKKVSKAEQLYNAVVEDDGRHLTRVMATWDDPKTAVSNLVSAVKDAYLDGKITDDRATEYLQEFGSKSLEQVSDYLSEWGFKKAYLESELKDSNARNYIELAKPAGIGLEVYTQFCKETEGLEADKDEEGNDIQNSKREKVWKVIHSLPLSDKQKDALHYAAGYAESSLDDAPWN